MRRVGIFGWGVVAPRSPNIEAFERNLASSESWLSPFEGFGPSNFLVGQPEFEFSAYKPWIDARFPPTRFAQIERKMGLPTQYAVGAFIQALGQNPGLEQALQALGPRAHTYVGTGLGDLPTIYDRSIDHHRAQRRWDRFWADPERNAPLREWLAGDRAPAPGMPPFPETVKAEERDEAEEAWWHHWAARSPALAEYLEELREIESIVVEGDVESAKLAVIKEKRTRNAKLEKKWGAPTPPWNAVDANLLWNIHNGPAAQVSMLGKLTGMCFAPVAACSSFGYGLKLAMNAIRLGEAKAVVLGMTDPPPHALTVGGFYNARVIAADRAVSKPLTGLRGTHVAGGAVVWVVGDLEHFVEQGFRPLGAEPLSVGVTADAEHIITPSNEGPTEAIRLALEDAGVTPAELGTWDLHATATPGDFLEVKTLREHRPRVGARHRAQGHLRPRHVRRRRLGAHRAVPRPRPRHPLPDPAHRGRAQPRHRRRAPPLRARPGLPRAEGDRREALDGRRRVERLRALSARARVAASRDRRSVRRAFPPARSSARRTRVSSSAGAERLRERGLGGVDRVLGRVGVVGGHHQDRQLGVEHAHPCGEVAPAHPRHHQVGEHEADLPRARGEALERLDPVGRLGDLVPVSLEHPADRGADRGLVLDQRGSVSLPPGMVSAERDRLVRHGRRRPRPGSRS